MTKPSAADLISLIVENAPALRKAGVSELALEGFSVKLSPVVDDTATALERDQPEPPLGLLDDPAVYGLPPGSPVPGFAALREREKGERS